jgi:hypothetical protein
VFSLEHHFALKSFAALHEAKRVLTRNFRTRQTVCRLVTKCRGTGSVLSVEKLQSTDKTTEITAVPISRSALAATARHGCRNSVLPPGFAIFVFVHKRERAWRPSCRANVSLLISFRDVLSRA